MGRYRMSSDRSSSTRQSGKRRRVVRRASPATSSSISSCIFRGMVPSCTRVTDSRFSTMTMRLSASCLISESMARFLEDTSGVSSSTETVPEMEVRGVRRSWDTARRMFSRMATRSDSS